MSEPLLENGFAEVGDGAWLLPLSQPAARLGAVAIRAIPRFSATTKAAKATNAEEPDPSPAGAGTPRATPLGAPATSGARGGLAAALRRFLSPDRSRLRVVAVPENGRLWCADRTRPFLARLDVGEPLSIVSEKLLLAPASARAHGRLLRVIPFSLRAALCITELVSGYAIAATASRVRRIAVPDGATLAVRPEALVAWCGPSPTGSCGRLRTRDLFLPRLPRSLALDFHGPCLVWLEGSAPEK